MTSIWIVCSAGQYQDWMSFRCFPHNSVCVCAEFHLIVTHRPTLMPQCHEHPGIASFKYFSLQCMKLVAGIWTTYFKDMHPPHSSISKDIFHSQQLTAIIPWMNAYKSRRFSIQTFVIIICIWHSFEKVGPGWDRIQMFSVETMPAMVLILFVSHVWIPVRTLRKVEPCPRLYRRVKIRATSFSARPSLFISDSRLQWPSPMSSGAQI